MASLDVILTASVLLGLAPVVGAQEVDYNRDIRPILADHCFTCHGPDEGTREARLRLDTLAGLEKPLGRDHLILPGEPEESELFLRVTEEDEDYRMPPVESGEPLAAEQVDLLRRWIEQGAAWEAHWAYAPFDDVQLPSVSDAAWSEHPIDRFVHARLEREGAAPSEEANRRTLLRRVSLDLVGLTPTPEELQAYLADGEPGAYERVVERLLASSAYAEHQARLWLDLARYADSHGFTIDGGRSMWPYRDWVVDAIDADMPFDEFTREQLAGDLFESPTRSQLIATGFHRNTQINQEGGAKDEENRVNAVIDRVDTTGSVWLGSSLTCARCHTHKYDPISQTEYFQVFAFYNQTVDGGVSSEPSLLVPDEDDLESLLEFEEEDRRLSSQLDDVQRAASADWNWWVPQRATGSNGPELRVEEDRSIRSIGQNPVTSVYVLEGAAQEGARALRLEALPDLGLSGRGPGRSGNGNFVLNRLRLYHREPGEEEFSERPLISSEASYSQGFGPEGGNLYPVAGALDDEAGTGWAVSPRFGKPHVAHFEWEDALPAGDVRIELYQDFGSHHVLGRFRVAFAGQTSTASVPEAWEMAWNAWTEHQKLRPRMPSTLVMRDREVKRPNRLFIRGDFLNPGKTVVPGVPAALRSFDYEGEFETRLDLANWLTDPRNALVHRVTVNREWQHFFATGIVETESDFGIRGAPPSHPELLEWLAREFVRQGFSRKELHRTIVTSRAYRQSSAPRPELDALDPRGRLLGRQSRWRVNAEVIRDSALRVSGALSAKRGGPPVQPPQPAGVFAFTQSKKSWKPAEGEDRYRRTLYTRLWRSSTYPFLTTFDAPVANVTCTRRGRSNTALQALTMANDPMVLEIAALFGERLRDAGASDRERLTSAFENALGRPGSERELEILLGHLERVRALRNAEGLDALEVEAKAWAAVARVIFNLDEFVTRG